MAYGLRYQNEFNSASVDGVAQRTYLLKFLFKDYTGLATSVEGGGTSVVQKCTLDDPIAPIKGQSLDITLVNEAGTLSITNFMSDDDDGVMVELSEAGNVLFIGFLVQDDFYEPMVDHTHTITLSATDNLGLLKGVVLSNAAVRRAFNVSFRTNGVNTVVYMYTLDPAFYPQAGNTIEIQGVSYIISTAVNENTVIGIATYNWTITLTTATPGIAQTVEIIYLTGEVNLLNRNNLLSLIAVCLGQTNVSLMTNIFTNHCEYRQDPAVSTFEQTLLDSQLFISGETYDDCYTALTKILTAFNCTLFQANGQWNIVHWLEFRRWANNAVPGFVYDETWTAAGTTLFSNNFNIGPAQLTTWLSGLQQGALRGWKFSRKVFDYRQPKYLLKNSDLQILGVLLRQYVSGSSTVYEYYAPFWQGGVGPTLCERFIRVTKDTGTNSETDRSLVVRGPNSDTTRAVASTDFEMNTGDKLKFSFSFQTNISQPGSLTIIFAVRLFDGTTTRYVDEVPSGNGNWISTVGFNYTISSGDNSNAKHNVEITSSAAPFSGLVTCFLAVATNAPYNSSRETLYRDIRLEYTPYVNDQLAIIGQIHKQVQPPNKKLNNDVDIVIDDSPRNSIAGTLFLTTKTPANTYGLQNRTAFWGYPNPPSGDRRLGELNTYEELLYKRATRTRLEGGFIGNYQSGVPVSLLTMLIMAFYPNKNYTFGLLTIDYKRSQFSGTLYELYDITDAELDAEYSLTYKYETQ